MTSPARALELVSEMRPANVDPALADPAERRRLSGPALRTFLNIAEHWRLNEAERLRLLGLPARSTYYAWTEKARARAHLSLGLDPLLRISAVLGIYQALAVVFPREQDAFAWLRASHQGPLFGGQRPLDLMISGTQDGLLAVRVARRPVRPPNAADRAAPPLDDADIVHA